jgi:hypothetical protein
VEEDLPDRGEVTLGDVRGRHVRLQDVAELAHLAAPDARHAAERGQQRAHVLVLEDLRPTSGLDASRSHATVG